MDRKGKALRKILTLENKDEASRTWFQQGYFACRKAAYAAFAMELKNMDISQDQLVEIMRNLDDRLMFYSGEDELIDEAFAKTGIVLDFDGVFSDERIQKKEEDCP